MYVHEGPILTSGWPAVQNAINKKTRSLWNTIRLTAYCRLAGA